MIRAACFIAVSAVAVYASRATLRRPPSHGFYRLFAWEFIVVLILVNFRSFAQWFGDPVSARQLASWFLLLLSLLPLGLGVHLLRSSGQANAQRRSDPALFPIERTTRLVTTGVFGYIRHPLYASLLLLTWGVFLKRPSWIGAGLGIGSSVLLLATAIAEEHENVRYFGLTYEAYLRNTKRFIPFLF